MAPLHFVQLVLFLSVSGTWSYLSSTPESYDSTSSYVEYQDTSSTSSYSTTPLSAYTLSSYWNSWIPSSSNSAQTPSATVPTASNNQDPPSSTAVSLLDLVTSPTPWYATTAGKWGLGVGGGSACAGVLGILTWCVKKRRRRALKGAYTMITGGKKNKHGSSSSCDTSSVYDPLRNGQHSQQQQQPFLYDPNLPMAPVAWQAQQPVMQQAGAAWRGGP